MAEPAKAWNPVVEERTHPFGEQGVRSSLEEVAKRAAKGALHPRVNTWARNTLVAARDRGEVVKKPRDRARVLLGAVQKKLWIPDPVGAEYIAGAHLLACDDDSDGQVCIRGSDCDELVCLLAASMLSVGLYTMIVGHAYDTKQRIEHVLCAVHFDGRWHYADPSTDFPLGKCVPFTRERLLSIPNVKVVCDDRACLSSGKKFDPEELDFVERGVFVGVDGPPDLPPTHGLASPLVWLSELDRGDLGDVIAAASGVTWIGSWLGQVLIDLKDPATMAEIKKLMRMIKVNYSNTSPTWSSTDWEAFSAIAEVVADQLKVSKGGMAAYDDGSGNAVQNKWPPSGTVGFPSYVGILNMTKYVVDLNKLTNKYGGDAHPANEAEAKTEFPTIASYGINVSGVTTPNFGPPEVAAKPSGGGASAALVIGGLALGAAAIALLARNVGQSPAPARALCSNPLCANPLPFHGH